MAALHHPEEIGGSEGAALLAGGGGVFTLGLANAVGMWLLSTGILPLGVTRPILSLLALTFWVLVWLWLRMRWEGKRLKGRLVTIYFWMLLVSGLALGSPLVCVFWHAHWP